MSLNSSDIDHIRTKLKSFPPYDWEDTVEALLDTIQADRERWAAVHTDMAARADELKGRIAELLSVLEAIMTGNIGGIAARAPQDVIRAYQDVARGALVRDRLALEHMRGHYVDLCSNSREGSKDQPADQP